MNQHPYLRAYMAGIVVPTLVLLVAVTVFTFARYVCNVPVPIERVIVFPLAIVPNLWGLWNIIYIALLAPRHVLPKHVVERVAHPRPPPARQAHRHPVVQQPFRAADRPGDPPPHHTRPVEVQHQAAVVDGAHRAAHRQPDQINAGQDERRADGDESPRLGAGIAFLHRKDAGEQDAVPERRKKPDHEDGSERPAVDVADGQLVIHAIPMIALSRPTMCFQTR